MMYDYVGGGNALGQHYNQNYSREQVKNIVAKFQKCLMGNDFIVSLNENRSENLALVREYALNSEKIKMLLLGVGVDDFCHSLNNTKKGYEHEVLYVFSPQWRLTNVFGEAKRLSIYVKINFIRKQANDFCIVISFHKRNKKIAYLFR